MCGEYQCVTVEHWYAFWVVLAACLKDLISIFPGVHRGFVQRVSAAFFGVVRNKVLRLVSREIH